jgi:hypothetical protein
MATVGFGDVVENDLLLLWSQKSRPSRFFSPIIIGDHMQCAVHLSLVGVENSANLPFCSA